MEERPEVEAAPAKLSLLLVDDDTELCSMMKEFFSEMHCQLDCAYNGRDGLTRVLKHPYDLVILDIMLPVVNGLTVLQQLRRHKEVPVIMLTARIQSQDRIAGLDSGADDYLAKPFDPDELLARIRAVLRRTGKLHGGHEPVKTFGDIQLNIGTREVWSAGQILDLTSLEFDILALLIRASGRIVRETRSWPCYSSVRRRRTIVLWTSISAICARSSNRVGH